MEFGKVFPELCQFGAYQRLLYYLILMPIQINYYGHIYSHLFIAIPPEQFWCASDVHNNQQQQQHQFVPSEHLVMLTNNNLSSLMESVNHSWWIYRKTLSRCHQYNITNRKSYEQLVLFHQHLYNRFNSNQSSTSPSTTSMLSGQTKITVPEIIPCQDRWIFPSIQHHQQDHYSIVTKWNLVCQHEWKQYLLQWLLFVGLVFGFLLHYGLSYNLGYRRSYFILLALQCSSGTLSSICNQLNHFALCRFLLGISLANTCMVSSDIMIEIAGTRSMSIIVFLNEIVRLSGALLLALIAHCIPDYGNLLLALSLPFSLFMLGWWSFPESLNYLLMRGQIDRLQTVILDIAHTNIQQQFLDNSFKRRIEMELVIYRELMISSLLSERTFTEILLTNNQQDNRSISNRTSKFVEVEDQVVPKCSAHHSSTSLQSILSLANMKRKFLVLLWLASTNLLLNIAFTYFITDWFDWSSSTNTTTSATTFQYLFVYSILVNLASALFTYWCLDRFGRKFTYLTSSLLATLMAFITGLLMSSIGVHHLSPSTDSPILYESSHYKHHSLISYGLMKALQNTSFLVLVVWLYELLWPNGQCRRAFCACWTMSHISLLALPILLYYQRKSPRLSIQLSIQWSSTTHVLNVQYAWHYLLSSLLLFISSVVSLILPETGTMSDPLPGSLQEAEMFCSTSALNQRSNIGTNKSKPNWYDCKVLFNFQTPNIRPMSILKKPTTTTTMATTTTIIDSPNDSKRHHNNHHHKSSKIWTTNQDVDNTDDDDDDESLADRNNIMLPPTTTTTEAVCHQPLNSSTCHLHSTDSLNHYVSSHHHQQQIIKSSISHHDLTDQRHLYNTAATSSYDLFAGPVADGFNCYNIGQALNQSLNDIWTIG